MRKNEGKQLGKYSLLSYFSTLEECRMTGEESTLMCLIINIHTCIHHCIFYTYKARARREKATGI